MSKKYSKRKSSSKNCNGWCPPTVIYLTLSVTTTVLSLFGVIKNDELKNGGKNKRWYAITHGVGIMVWTGVLFLLCSNCYYKTSWAVLLTPIILAFVMTFAILGGMFGGVLKDKIQKEQVRERMRGRKYNDNNELCKKFNIKWENIKNITANEIGVDPKIKLFISSLYNYCNKEGPKPNKLLPGDIDSIRDGPMKNDLRYFNQNL